MGLTEYHASILASAFTNILGDGEPGALAFARCLDPETARNLAEHPSFAPEGWRVWRVADKDDATPSTIAADRAVEIRESKGDPALLLVDAQRAGAGMDGVYSAAREIDESRLFAEAAKLAGGEITRRTSGEFRAYTERAIRAARRYARVSPWAAFDFRCHVADAGGHPGAFLHLLGLWPVAEGANTSAAADLAMSRSFVEDLLGVSASGLTPRARVDSLRLLSPDGGQKAQREDLERFVRAASAKPLFPALAELADRESLWVNALRLESGLNSVEKIELVSWRRPDGKIYKWSGLVPDSEPGRPPVLVLDPDAAEKDKFSNVEIHWKAQPAKLEKGCAEYAVAIVGELDREIVATRVPHTARAVEKARFDNDDFAELSEDVDMTVKAVVSVVGDDSVEPQESEDFVIRVGDAPETERVGGGKKVRTFSEGLIDLDDRETVTLIAHDPSLFSGHVSVDAKGFVTLRPERGKSYRVFRPPLIDEIEQEWIKLEGKMGRWRVDVRATGERANKAEFKPFEGGGKLWERVETASRRMAERCAAFEGGVGQIHDDRAKNFGVVREYVLAWTALWEEYDNPTLALVNTVEVRSLSGKTIGLIVPSSHPLRVVWAAAYDNLALHARFKENRSPTEIRRELACLDGAMFPALLPGPKKGSSFVFVDTLGFHAVGMAPDSDPEPKATADRLARALGGEATGDAVPTVGRQSAEVLAAEIGKYLECHDTQQLLHLHAHRAGDGFTVARALGGVFEKFRRGGGDDAGDSEDSDGTAPAFVLEFYPSPEQRGIAGRFIADTREKRRRGAGSIDEEDRWMLESIDLPGGVSLPRLRWARREKPNPETAAHIAVAFDTFESRVETEAEEDAGGTTPRPLHAFGLLSFFDREYTGAPSPSWRAVAPAGREGEKHPSGSAHSDRLARMRGALDRLVARNLGVERGRPILRTDISPDNAESLRRLHRLSDWVVTLDRNAGVEYFDSPNDDPETYDAYVIDCVPEREDLGCLQLITSTGNRDEVQALVDDALDRMGLSRSRRNAEFLLGRLKALSGRLAIRLTGQKAPSAELVALAVAHANCARAPAGDACWTSLEDGFLVPVDDVRDLLPPLNMNTHSRRSERKNPDARTSLPLNGPGDGNGELEEESAARPDLIHVSRGPRGGLRFGFVEVKYRRHLRTARAPSVLRTIRNQVESLRRRWGEWFGEDVAVSFRSIRRAKLARMLRFYADKARRHGLAPERHAELIGEIDRMIEKGGDYAFEASEDRGWVFCPEYMGGQPLKVSPSDWDTRIFQFGPGLLPDSNTPEDPPPPDGGPDGRPPAAALAPSRNGETGGAPAAAGDEAEPDPAPSETGPAADIAPASGDEGDPPAMRFGTDTLTGEDVRWPLTVKGNPHLLIAGLPGMGKTTCILNMCQQMIGAGVRPIVFSYHQDIDERLVDLVGSVRFVDFDGLGFNPLQVLDRRSRRAYLDVAGALRDVFMAIYPELGDIQGERIRNAVKESFEEAGWRDAEAGTPLDEPPFQRFVEILRADPKPDRGLRTLLARLSELDDYGFFDPRETRENLWEGDRPTVIRIHTTQNDNLQRAFSFLIFYGLYKDMFRRGLGDRITHALIFDEAHRAAGLRLIPTMAKECRKYGISLVLASQQARDFNASLYSAIANYLILRLTESDAKALVRNVAVSQRERALIDKVKEMDRFKAVYFCEGRRKPFSVALAP